MKGNSIKNSVWCEREGEFPRYFKTDGQLHFDQTEIDGYKVGSLSFSKEDYERLVYTETINTVGKRQLTMGLIIRENDVDEINYKVAFYNEADSCIDVCCHNVASEVTPHFKRICVTYPIPADNCYVRVGWEFKGIVTGVTFFHPSLILID